MSAEGFDAEVRALCRRIVEDPANAHRDAVELERVLARRDPEAAAKRALERRIALERRKSIAATRALLQQIGFLVDSFEDERPREDEQRTMKEIDALLGKFMPHYDGSLRGVRMEICSNCGGSGVKVRWDGEKLRCACTTEHPGQEGISLWGWTR